MTSNSKSIQELKKVTTCSGCGALGHFEDECPQKGHRQRSSSSDRSSGNERFRKQSSSRKVTERPRQGQKRKVGESSSKRPFQLNKSTVVTKKKNISMSNVVAKQEMISSFIKLQERGVLGRQDVHYAPNITDPLLPWGSSIHLYPGECWLETSQEESKQKLWVKTPNLVLVTMTDFGDDHLEFEGDVFAGKRSHEDEDTSSGESDGTSGTSSSPESDADVVPEKRRHRRAYHKPTAPRKTNPPAFIQQSPAFQSELKKLQRVATRGSGVSKAERDKVCKAANDTISLLQPGSKASDVASTFTSHATGWRRQHVFETSAMDADDNSKKKIAKRGTR